MNQLNQACEPLNVQAIQDLLERLRDTFRLYEHASAVAQQQLTAAITEAERIRREATTEGDRLRLAAAAECDQLAAEVETLRAQRDRLRHEIAQALQAQEARKRQVAEEAAALQRSAHDLLASLQTLVRVTNEEPGHAGWIAPRGTGAL